MGEVALCMFVEMLVLTNNVYNDLVIPPPFVFYCSPNRMCT